MDLRHDKISDMLFRKTTRGYYEPFATNYDEESGKFKPIIKNKIFKEVMEFVSLVRRQRNKKTGKYRSLPLFPYQWAFIFKYVDAVLNEKSTKYVEAYARQSGKSESIKITLAYLLVFMARYKDIKIERFNATLVSYKDKSVQKLFDECKPYIYKAVEMHNKKYPRDELLIKEHGYKNGIDNSNQLTIDKRFRDGEIIPYAQVFAVTGGVGQDSLSSHIIFADEAGKIDNGLYETSFSSFTTTTGGIQSFIGVPNHNSASLLFQKYINRDIKHTIYNWESVYNLRLLVDKEFAENYLADYKSQVRTNGANSAFVRWNYELDFEDMNGKFITRKLLEESNMMSEKVRTPSKDAQWICAGLDISPKSDYFVLTIGETEHDKYSDTESKSVCEIITFNKDGGREEAESRAQKVAEIMKKYKVDILCVDSTSHQLYFIQSLYKHLNKINSGTMLVPLPYNANKQKLFGYLEDSLFDGSLKLLIEDESWESEKLIEEMLYLLKTENATSEKIDYGAPNKQGFTDDHVNSLALFNIALKYCKERANDKSKRIADDGANKWRIRVRKNDSNSIGVQAKKKSPKRWIKGV